MNKLESKSMATIIKLEIGTFDIGTQSLIVFTFSESVDFFGKVRRALVTYFRISFLTLNLIFAKI